MAKLTDPEKHEIVLLLARFASPSEVVAIMRRDYGVEIDRFQVRTYDPENPKYAAGERWREIFVAARKKYLEEVAAIPIASQAFRLNKLNELFDKSVQQGNLGLAAKLLEQAAVETVRFKAVDGLGNSAQHRSLYRDMSPDERRAKVADMFREAFSKDANDRSDSKEKCNTMSQTHHISLE